MFGAETPAGRGLALLALLDLAEPRVSAGGGNHRAPRGAVKEPVSSASETRREPEILSLEPLAECPD
jgi:hypothetical protein